MDIAKVTEQYYDNNAEKLHKMVDKILKKYGGLSQKDIDDFYSLNEYSKISYEEAAYICRNCKLNDCNNCNIWKIACG